MKHYQHYKNKVVESCCGASLVFDVHFAYPKDISCIDCLRSEIYKQDLIAFELKFEGNCYAWVIHTYRD